MLSMELVLPLLIVETGWLSILTILLMIKYKYNTVKRVGNRRWKTTRYRKKRYIVFLIESQRFPSKDELEKAIRNSLKEIVGEIGLSLADPKVVFLDDKIWGGIVLSKREFHASVIVAMQRVRQINNQSVILIPRRTTGTIKKARLILKGEI
ncbi:ribonuclease P [Sulfolobales archaeon HS-7]|nr:ribonuclease P [Sulfolobales archaeon HS-7]